MTGSLSNLWSSDKGLQASRRQSTGEIVFPAIPPLSPIAALYSTVEVNTYGLLYSFTVIHPNARSGEPTYALGYLDVPGPLRLFGRFSAGARACIGGSYKVISDPRFGYVFESGEQADSQ